MRGRLGAALHENWSDLGRASWDEHRAERNPYHSHPQLTALHMNTPPSPGTCNKTVIANMSGLSYHSHCTNALILSKSTESFQKSFFPITIRFNLCYATFFTTMTTAHLISKCCRCSSEKQQYIVTNIIVLHTILKVLYIAPHLSKETLESPIHFSEIVYSDKLVSFIELVTIRFESTETSGISILIFGQF